MDPISDSNAEFSSCSHTDFNFDAYNAGYFNHLSESNLSFLVDEEVLHCYPCHLPHTDEDPQKEVCAHLI